MPKKHRFDLQFFADNETEHEVVDKPGKPKRKTPTKRETAVPKKSRSYNARKKKKKLESDFDDDNLIRYVVQPGDTIYKLARRFHSTPRQICELNNLHKPTLLVPGDVIVLPENF